MKEDTDLEMIAKQLCRNLSTNLTSPIGKLSQHLKDDLIRVLNIDDYCIDKSIIVSCFLFNVNVSFITKCVLIS